MRWIDLYPVDIPDSFKKLDLQPLIAQTLIRRGISTPETARAFLDPASYHESSPYDLPGILLYLLSHLL